jgi:hypothetical protein
VGGSLVLSACDGTTDSRPSSSHTPGLDVTSPVGAATRSTSASSLSTPAAATARGIIGAPNALSKDIQQDAQEMVRRAEYALGRAIRKGQDDRTVQTHADGTKVGPRQFFDQPHYAEKWRAEPRPALRSSERAAASTAPKSQLCEP